LRTRERLIEVLQSANATEVTSPWQAEALRLAAAVLAGKTRRKGNRLLTRANMRFIVRESQSEHLRELAAEALHYLTEDGIAD
jgi:hypothetical protein